MPEPKSNRNAPLSDKLGETAAFTSEMIDPNAATRITAEPPPAAAAAALDEELIGSALDVYRIDSFLGAGGMGRVYKGWHERLHRFCAIKVITAELIRQDPLRRELFFNEARASARLHHPNVVQVHSLGEDRGFHFIEMEYVAGPSLKQWLDQEGPASPLVATRLVAQIARALACAHSFGLVHGDVKPDNLLAALEADSKGGRSTATQVKLTDFGLARAMVTSGDDASRRLAGTPLYMAPELFDGEPASVASDVYALGVTYFALLTGRTPFHGDSLFNVAEQHQQVPPPKVSALRPDVPAAVCDLIDSMLAKNPAARPRCDAAFVERLESIATSLINLRHLVEEGTRELAVEWSSEGERFVFDVLLEDGRRQRVEAEVIPALNEHEPLVTFWSPCAPAIEPHDRFCLEMNGWLPFGAIGIRMWEGQPYFVMVENLPRGSVSPDAIRAAVMHLAQSSDLVEKLLTGKDIH